MKIEKLPLTINDRMKIKILTIVAENENISQYGIEKKLKTKSGKSVKIALEFLKFIKAVNINISKHGLRNYTEYHVTNLGNDILENVGIILSKEPKKKKIKKPEGINNIDINKIFPVEDYNYFYEVLFESANVNIVDSRELVDFSEHYESYSKSKYLHVKEKALRNMLSKLSFYISEFSKTPGYSEKWNELYSRIEKYFGKDYLKYINPI